MGDDEEVVVMEERVIVEWAHFQLREGVDATDLRKAYPTVQALHVNIVLG